MARSSLALPYVENLAGLLATVHSALVHGAPLVFSVEHLICTASRRPGWIADGAGRRVWPDDAYGVEGGREVDWLGGVVVKQHRTIGTILNLLIGAGFAVSHVEDWRPTWRQATRRRRC